ncbi:hypothetical protein [Roseivirga pacifica]|uniref:hypothetical protein n=1 Tax=Roseivirga pacifica TaxID=1267423 RepID=UPI00209594BF|nr:hypothetical protein [Roseivirga pacifica]MCO6360237.1 hypothetical protein [Roseivirga pacifica]MCO6367608.1 hypothetical protein [Roseivirga pacifica]MCO6369860.1 hypothetical protein [Roseivirga pacifica]MCO6375265.1 hypothetical protein [Roseivirga pacifica]MCO6380523.1 hypothetical protein [Roseivirga pacifica]
MKIKPGVGIDNLKFGMTEEQIFDLVGTPTTIVVDKDDEDKNLVYQYNELKLRLTFYREYGLKFGYVRTSNPKITLNNKAIIGIPINDAIKIFEINEDYWNEEQYFTFNSYFNEKMWTTLNVEYGVVTDIEFGYLFDEKGEKPYWPE